MVKCAFGLAILLLLNSAACQEGDDVRIKKFIEAADKNNDKLLSKTEFLDEVFRVNKSGRSSSLQAENKKIR